MGWWRRQVKEAGWVAVAAQGSRLRAVHVVDRPPGQDTQRARLNWFQEADSAPALLAHGPRADRIWLLARNQYQFLLTDAPDASLPAADWPDALRWQLKGQLDAEPADMVLDLLRVPGNPGLQHRNQVWVAAAPRPVVAAVVAQAEVGQGRLAAIDIAETALRNLCGRCEPSGRAQALLSFGSGVGHLVITHQGELLVARTIDVPAEGLVSEDDARREALVDRAALEVQRTLDSFERLFSHLSLGRLLIVPAPGMAGLATHLSAFVSTPVETFDLETVFELDTESPLRGAGGAPWLLALGAALREAA